MLIRATGSWTMIGLLKC